MPQAAEGLFTIGSSTSTPNAFSGLPVRVVSFRDGTAQTVSEVTEASRQNFPDTLFQVPAGYQKREFPGWTAARPAVVVGWFGRPRRRHYAIVVGAVALHLLVLARLLANATRSCGL